MVPLKKEGKIAFNVFTIYLETLLILFKGRELISRRRKLNSRRYFEYANQEKVILKHLSTLAINEQHN